MIARLLANAQKGVDASQSSPSGPRLGPYNELVVSPVFHNKVALAEEGTYFSNGQAAAATAITYGVTTAYTTFATSFPFAVLQNNAAAGGTNLVPDFLRFVLTTAPAAAVSAYLTLVLDQARSPSANFSLLSNAVNHNGNSGTASASNLFIPATGTNMTLPAATASARTLVRAQQMRVQIPVALDEMVIQFGSIDGLASGFATPASGSAGPGRIVAQVPPVVIPPQWFLLAYLWFPSSTGFAAFNYLEEGHYER